MSTVKESKSVEEILPDINTRYGYVLAQKNTPIGKVFDENGNKRGEPIYKPYMNLIFRSSIIWPGGKDPFSKIERPRGKYILRYYDGCTTLFADDQPKDKATLDIFINSTRGLVFSNGHLFVFGYDVMLKIYMDWCSYNEDSPYRVPSVTIKFKNINTEKQMAKEAQILELEDKARDLAKNAEVNKMKIHAKYLGIAFEDETTMQELSIGAIRTSYRQFAKNSPKYFIDSYNDKTIEVSTWIKDALYTGKISTTIISNSAVWAKGNSVICDISGLKAQHLIVEKLVEFSQMDIGADFMAQLKMING